MRGTTLITSGLDLGQRRDYTAFASSERDARGVHTLVALERFRLGQSYVEMVESVRKWFDGPRLRGTRLAVDYTGVGLPVLDMFRAAGIKASLRPITITGGRNVNVHASPLSYAVPKHDLVAVVQVCLGEGRLRIPAALPNAKVLIAELQNFRSKISAAGNESFEAARERDHDDLVLAVAVMLWCAEKLGSGDPSAIGLPERREVPRGVFEDVNDDGAITLWQGGR